MNKFFSFIFITFALFLMTSLFAQEKKSEPPVLTEPGIVLTFDDSGNLEGWAKRIPLFKKYGAKATFFLDKPDKLNDRQKEAMKQLAEIGCEMASHGLRHQHGAKLLEEKGREVYLNEEILPCIKALEDLGYPQKTLGYAFSSRSKETDEALMPYFKHIRTGSGVCDRPIDKLNHIFMPLNNVRDQYLVQGCRFDKTDVEGVTKFVRPGLQRIKEKGEILLFYGHGIVDSGAGTYQTNADALEELLKQTKELGLKFYTFDEL